MALTDGDTFATTPGTSWMVYVAMAMVFALMMGTIPTLFLRGSAITLRSIHPPSGGTNAQGWVAPRGAS